MENVIEIKSFNFADRIVNLYKHLTDTKKEYVLSKQLLRSGTSIGANVAEAEQAQSKPDFVWKSWHRRCFLNNITGYAMFSVK